MTNMLMILIALSALIIILILKLMINALFLSTKIGTLSYIFVSLRFVLRGTQLSAFVASPHAMLSTRVFTCDNNSAPYADYLLKA